VLIVSDSAASTPLGLADSDFEPDPLFVASAREARWILLMWAGCFVWTMWYCLNHGYQTNVDPGSFPTVLGIPEWVALGIALPWCIANVVTIAFCLGYMQDADLGEAQETVAGDSRAAKSPEPSHV